jgi:glucan 1,3-beta-glucosidase
MFASSRPAALVNSTGFYHTVIPPTYEEYDASQVINVKDVSDHPVSGDGKADDTASLQAIINAAAGKNIVYFPYGTYILTDTLLVPPGSRLIGEAWTKLSARGSKFKDAKNPRAMIKVGNTGDVGVAQMTDFLFTISENVPGAVLVEVNMASDKPGDVGFFNNHFLVMGGTARLCAHFTSSASVYWENSWATGQGNSDSAPGAAGGFLVEALNGTWIVGLGSGESGSERPILCEPCRYKCCGPLDVYANRTMNRAPCLIPVEH